jgi:HAD superfamily hydrolase (TIGR01459 family)
LSPVQLIDGIAPLASRYDGFILDVWGVLHNGEAPYPGVIDALEHLNAAGKRITLLSNAPMRAAVVAERVQRIGVPMALFQNVMSSGEEVWRSLHDRPDDFYRSLGPNCLWLGPDRHSGMVDGLHLSLVETADDADFILNTGPDELDDACTDLLPLLTGAARRGVPMVCANADLHVMQGDTLIVCAGQVAKIYEGLGGLVRWHGKPFSSVYHACLSLLGVEDRSRILAVGDSLRTDIAGANRMGIDCLLLADGIHAAEFGPTLDPARIADRIGDGPTPTYVGYQLSW